MSKRFLLEIASFPLAVVLSFFAAGLLLGQDNNAATQELALKDFRPKSKLKVEATDLRHAKFPAIDIHTHFGFRLQGDEQALTEFVELMNRNNIALCNSLDATLGPSLDDHTEFLDPYKDRFAIFTHLDFKGGGKDDDFSTWACNQPGFVHWVVEQLKIANNKGIVGLKFFKSFGLEIRDAKGKLIKIDDPRWDPIWTACADLKMPVLIHVADPVAFFDPIDKHNERWEELSRHPDWSFYGEQFPARQELIDARNRVIKKHPNTIFIGAHVANNSEDLETVGQWLDEYPNLYVDIASRISELGRQPYTARKFLIKYQDRFLFGTDGPWPELRLWYYWRFLETYDEYFPYSEKEFPPQGMWRIYGIGLPDEVLQKIYYRNALRIIPGLEEKYPAAKQKLK
jgi:predicted TIM-barrel fold metal-dependent hydrolase